MADAKERDLDRKHQEDLERIRNFRLMDDDFMSKVFEDTACAEFLLKVILNRDDLAVDEKNRVYNIEVQRSDRGAGAKRARYNSSLLDANLTQPGDGYDALNETYIIFITERDVLKRNLPIYHVNRIIEETGEAFGDEAHIIYVNSQIKDETALGKLMHDFSCTDPEDMKYPVLAERVKYFKEDTKGVTTMCRALERMRDETIHEKAVDVALSMLADGLPYEQIAKYTKLSVEEIKTLDTKKSA